MNKHSSSSRLSIIVLLLLLAFGNSIAQTKKTKPIANINANEIWIDRFDTPTGKAITKGDWFMYNDKSNDGASQIYPSDSKQAYKLIPERNNDGAFEFSYILNKGNYKWEPYVGVGVNIVDSNISVNIDNIKGIAYDYKGSRHTTVYQLSSVKDYAHYKRVVPESEEWKTMIIPITEFKQPNAWGKKVEFNATLIQSLQWTIFGRTGDSGTLCIDNIRLLRKLPKVKEVKMVHFNPPPIAQEKIVPEQLKITDYKKEVSDKVKVADWFDFSKAAYSLSFDDGLISQYKYVAPILDGLGLKATFYIVSETLESDPDRPASWRYGYWWQFIELCKKGHELGSHSATHPKLTTFPDGGINKSGTLQYELNAPIQKLDEKFPGYKFITFAYPFVDFNQHVKDETAKLYVSSRGLGNGFNDAHNIDWMNLQGHGLDYSPNRTLETDLAKMSTLENWITNNTIAKGGWTVYLAHDVLPFEEASVATDSWQPVSSESFEAFAKWLKEKQTSKELWVETVGNVTRYIKERNAVSVVLLEETSEKLVFSIKDYLPDDQFNYPLTLEITIPSNWGKVGVTQQNNRYAKNVMKQTLNGKVIINVIPDKGNIVISNIK